MGKCSCVNEVINGFNVGGEVGGEGPCALYDAHVWAGNTYRSKSNPVINRLRSNSMINDQLISQECLNKLEINCSNITNPDGIINVGKKPGEPLTGCLIDKKLWWNWGDTEDITFCKPGKRCNYNGVTGTGALGDPYKTCIGYSPEYIKKPDPNNPTFKKYECRKIGDHGMLY